MERMVFLSSFMVLIFIGCIAAKPVFEAIEPRTKEYNCGKITFF